MQQRDDAKRVQRARSAGQIAINRSVVRMIMGKTDFSSYGALANSVGSLKDLLEILSQLFKFNLFHYIVLANCSRDLPIHISANFVRSCRWKATRNIAIHERKHTIELHIPLNTIYTI